MLEWLEGEPLEALLVRERAQGGRRRSVEEALHLLEPVARALALAHDLGIVHCDIKPGNICVLTDGAQRASGPTKLLDFGIAAVAHAGDLPVRGALLDSFTPCYGAPEQFFAERGSIGPWTDVFALAPVFVELLTGRDALRGESIAALASAPATLRAGPRRARWGWPSRTRWSACSRARWRWVPGTGSTARDPSGRRWRVPRRRLDSRLRARFPSRCFDAGVLSARRLSLGSERPPTPVPPGARSCGGKRLRKPR